MNAEALARHKRLYTLESATVLITMLAAVPVILSSCRPSPMMSEVAGPKQSDGGSESSRLVLPQKTFSRLRDGSLQITGHWTLKGSEMPPGEVPYGTQPLNSTIIRCWPPKRICEEYRTHVFRGILLPLEPLKFQVISADSRRIVAKCDLDVDIRFLFHIDGESEQVEMEFRREPSPGRGRVFERWVLE